MDATNSPSYTYQPLASPDAIRILLLQPAASFVDALRCDLINNNHTALVENEKSCSYEAVSYAWGSAEFTHFLACDDNSTKLRITANVDRMLRHLRQTKKARKLWIDATCINQMDVDERNAQVTLMGRIFRQASRTIAYIGDADEDSSALSLWCREQRFTLSEPDSWEDAFEDRFNYRFDSQQRERRESAARLAGRSWFARTWIIQETLLSQHLVLQAGNDTFSWLPFHRLIPGRSGMLDVKASFTETSESQSELNRSLRRRYSGEWLWQSRINYQPSISKLLSPGCLIDYGHLFEMLCETSDYGCADPRDKLFAVLSLFRGQIPRSLKPDYSLSVEVVYTNISRFLICYGVAKSLSAGQGVEGDSSLPTWAIDWRIPRNKIYKARPGFPFNDALAWYCAEDQAQAGFASDNRRMKVTPIGTQGLCLRGKCIERKFEPLPLSVDLVTWLSYPGLNIEWLERISGRLRDQHVKILRRDEQVGILPVESRAGDIVCVFLGIRVPFVLRPIAKGWQLVGECYLPWCMKGEKVAHIDWKTAYDDQPVAPYEDFVLY